jgi:hypothetical protein
MKSLSVSTHDVFEAWLEKEKEYLRAMKKEPLEETLEMEYYEKLVQYNNSEWVFFFFMNACPCR